MIVVADHANGKLVPVNCKRELVHLAAGLDHSTGKLRPGTASKAFRCLSSFSDYLSQFPEIRVRAVGTSAFRQLHNNPEFLKKAERVLGLPIEVLSGEDEAKLIYRGVSCTRPDQQRFVMDIGGGSTEFIVGQGITPKCFASLEVGSQTIKQRFFSSNQLKEQHLVDAQTYLAEQFMPVADLFQQFPWQQDFATSGSIKTVSWALQNLGLIKQGTITAEALNRLRPIFLQTETLHNLSQLVNLNMRRTDLLLSGFIIIDQAFNSFNLDRLMISNQAIREGMINMMMQDYQ